MTDSPAVTTTTIAVIAGGMAVGGPIIYSVFGASVGEVFLSTILAGIATVGLATYVSGSREVPADD